MSTKQGTLQVIPGERNRALYAKYVIVSNDGKKRAVEPASTLGKCDGPYEYRPELDCEVPTYISPRKDLAVIGKGAKTGVPTLKHHVPYCFRGPFKPEDLPKQYLDTIADQIKVDKDGIVLCTAILKGNHPQRKEVRPCRAWASNRVLLCRNHGGALHPADKKITSKRPQVPDEEKQEQLTRVEKVIMGLIPIHDLSDEEIVNAYVLDDAGKPVPCARLAQRVQQEMTKELMQRMQSLMQKHLPDMINTMATLATSTSVEPADRIKASIWMAERIIGKTPNVVVHADADKAYERVFDSIDSGSRDDFRKAKAIESTRVDKPGRMERLSASLAGEVQDAEVIDEDNFSDEEVEDYFENREELESEGFNHAEAHQNSEYYNSTSLESGDDDVASGDGSASVDPNPGYSYTARLAEEQKRIAEERKEARERIKRSRNRRFAMRATGTDNGDAMWLLEYGPYKEIQIKGVKCTVRHARLILPDAQSPAIVDRVTASYAQWETDRAARLELEKENGEG